MAMIDKKQTLKKQGKMAFWAWIAYQTLKGTLTTTFIWGPILLAWISF
jgi:hypothetical protein